MKRFHEFQLDVAHECLWRGGTRLSLTRKAFAILNCLVENANRIVTKDELMEHVWPGVFVGEENLKVYVRELRALLGDRASQPSFIETFRDRGYSFIAPVTESSAGVGDGSDRQNLSGRDTEMERLNRSFAQALQGTRQTIFVTGEPGIGKSSLVEAFLSRVTAHNPVHLAVGQCIESYHEQEAFYPVLESFGRLLKGPAGNQFATLLSQQAPTWLVQFPEAAKASDADILRSEIIGAGRERMLREIAEALEAFTAGIPLILVLEDVHWSDHSTLDFIAAVARRREPARLMLIATYRPVEIILSHHPLRGLKSELCSHRQAEELPLEFLTQGAVNDYLQTRFSGSLADELTTEVHQKTSGNPLFIVALADHLVSQDILVKTSDGWKFQGTLQQLRAIVPDSLTEIIQRQIEQLAPDEQELLTAGSVVGSSFSAAVVAFGLQRDPSEIEERFDSLSRRHLMVRRAGLQDLPNSQIAGLFQFTHILHHDALYHQLNPIARINLHQRIGEALEQIWASCEYDIAAELTRHFQESRDRPRVIRYLRLQARNAEQRYAYADAIELLDSALQTTEKLPAPEIDRVKLEILIQLAGVHDKLGEKLRAAELYEVVAKSAAATRRRQLEIESLLSQSRELAIVDPATSLEVANRAVARCDSATESALRVTTETWNRFMRLAWEGWDKQEAEAFREGVAWLRAEGELNLMAQQCFGLAIMQVFTGQHEAALQTTSEALPIMARAGDTIGHFTCRWMNCWALLRSGRGGEALAAMREAVSLAERNQNAFDTGIGQVFLAELHCEAFDPDAAVSLAENGLRLIRQSKSIFAMQRGLIISGTVHVDGGNTQQARQYLIEMSDLYESSPVGLSWYWKIELHCALAKLWLSLHETAAARRDIEKLRRLADAISHSGWQARARQLSARAAIAESDFARAQRDIEDALNTIQGQRIPTISWRVHDTAATVYERIGRPALASEQRLARNAILREFANSFDPNEPLRSSILRAVDLPSIGLPTPFQSASSREGRRLL